MMYAHGQPKPSHDSLVARGRCEGTHSFTRIAGAADHSVSRALE